MSELQAALAELQRVALATALNIAIPPRSYATREAALGTASYETLIRRRGPLGGMHWASSQNAIIAAGVRLGIVARKADGSFYRVGGE